MAKIKICLDAGHYAKYNRSPVVPEYYESLMNWKLHNLLKKYLEVYGFEVIQTRSDQKKDLELYSRGKASKGCDLFISIHSNACDTESVDRPVIIVQLDGKGDALGKKIGQCVRETMDTKQDFRVITRKGNRGEYYGVLRGAAAVGTVGMIIEHSFHTNTSAAKWLLDDSNLDRMARAEADVIASHYGAEKPQTGESSGDETASGDSGTGNTCEAVTLYRVQCGAYSVKKNADAKLAKVKAAGFDTYMVKVDGLFKIQVGAYSKKANAEAQLAKLKKAGFADAFITTKGGTGVAADPEPVKEIQVGSTVRVKKGAKTYTGSGLAAFVYERDHKVKEINGNRVVITFNGVVVAAVHKDNLILV